MVELLVTGLQDYDAQVVRVRAEELRGAIERDADGAWGTADAGAGGLAWRAAA